MSRVGADSSEGCGCRIAFKVNTNRALWALIHKTHLEISRVADSIKVYSIYQNRRRTDFSYEYLASYGRFSGGDVSRRGGG